jgi:putative sterol carrier protein
VAKHAFLSDEWMDEARKIREEYAGKTPPVAHVVKMNMVIKEVPFGDGVVNAHMDTTGGEAKMDTGHLDAPDLTVTTDYGTAKAIFIDGNPQAGMQAFMAGKVQIQGDMSKLMLLQSAPPDASAIEMQGKIKEITAD